MENINKEYLISKGFNEIEINRVGNISVCVYELDYTPPYKPEIFEFKLTVFFGNGMPVVSINGSIVTYCKSIEQFEALIKGLNS